MSTLNERTMYIPSGNITDKSGNVRTVNTGSQQTAAITGTAVDVQTDTDAVFIAIGSDPTAATDTSYRLFKGAIFRFDITPGDKIAAIIASGTANVYYHPVS